MLDRDEAHAELKSRNVNFGPFPQLEKAVKNDVEFLRNTKLIAPEVKTSGWVYEVETGKVKQVV